MGDEDSAGRPLTSDEEQFARALARTVLFIPRAFDADLGRDLRMTTSEFFTLAHLAEAAGGRLRMGDLAEVTALSLSATTKVVTKLETAGLVVRERAAGDRRGHEARLTGSGRTRLDGARSQQLASMRRRVFDKLEGADLASLTAALQRISNDG